MTVTMNRFEPADGVQARWRHCYDLAVRAINERGARGQITIREVTELLECDEPTAWAAMWEARKHLEQDGYRPLVEKPRFGWVIASASDALRVADKRRKKAGRQVKRGISVLRHTPRQELSQFERESADRELAKLNALADLHSRRRRLPLSEMEQLPPASGS